MTELGWLNQLQSKIKLKKIVKNKLFFQRKFDEK